MDHPRLSLATGMFAVLLLAADLAALRGVVDPIDGTPLNLILSLLPMANASAIAAYRLMSAPTVRQPFARGFLVGALAAMLAHTLCHHFLPGAMSHFYTVLFRAFVNFCRIYHVPGFILKNPDGRGASFRYYPLLAFVFCLPQFLAAIAVGSFFSRRARNIGGHDA